MKWAPLPKIPTQSMTVSSGHQIDVLRLDQTDASVSGNKWFKLKYNVIEAREKGFKQLLTFGGAYSNHIHATAAACKKFGLQGIAIIRGEVHLPLNPTLQFATDCGMIIHYITRTQYRDKYNPELIAEFKDTFGAFYMVPEGGTNQLALKGSSEIPNLFQKQYDYIALAAGTGGTTAGITNTKLCEHSKILSFPALKGGDFLQKDIEDLLGYTPENLEVVCDYHFGGYAKTTPELLSFMGEINQKYNLPLEPIYTAKAFYGLLDYLIKNNISKEASILFIHTGGLQGNNDVILG